MSRSGYTDDDDDQWRMIRWRGAVASATRGARGQKLLSDMLVALDSLPDKRLIATDLEADGSVCALGAVGKMRGLDMSKLDPYDSETIASTFGIAPALAREIVYENDQTVWEESSEHRFERMRRWASSQIEEPLHRKPD